MGPTGARWGIGLLTAALAVAVAGCNARPTPDAFDTSTTTSTVLADGAVTTPPPTLPPPDERTVATVVSVTDGDTIKVRLDGTTEDLRMLGINAPEQSECWGPESSVHLSNLIDGQDVTLVAGDEDSDEFGRLLRYVYLDTSGAPLFVNSEMVKSGNALGMSSDHEHADTFKALEASAFQSGAGMWGTFACGDSEGTAADRPVVRVSAIRFNPDGPDNEHLDEESVTIVNEGYGRVSLSGWVLRDESSRHRMTFPNGTVLAPGESITVVTGCEGGPTNAIHWCNDGAVWSNDGDTVIVSDTLGNAVIWYAYAGGRVDG